MRIRRRSGRRGRGSARAAALAVLLAACAACSPALDWRELRPEGSGAVLLFPCRASAQTRTISLAETAVSMALHACTAAGATWALAFADVKDPERVAAALAALRAAAVANVGAAAQSTETLALQVAGATPNPGSGRLSIRGHLPDGAAVQEQVAVFTRGTLVFQATVIGTALPAEGVDVFFTSIRTGL